MGPKKDETAVHCCDPALLVLGVVSQNVFHVVSAFSVPSSYFLFFFWLITSLVYPTLAAFIICGPFTLVSRFPRMTTLFHGKNDRESSFLSFKLPSAPRVNWK